MASPSVSFTVGEKFSSFLEFQAQVERYQRESNIQLYRRDSRSVEAYQKRCPNRTFNKDIKFAELTYTCIHGGKKFKHRGSGQRNQSTFKMGCKAEIKLVSSADGQHLVVKSVNELHNHDVHQAIFRNLFQQRRLEKNDKENIANMLSVKANTKMIQQRIMSETGKVVHLKDIHNIRLSSKVVNNDLSTLQSAVDHFSKANGAYVKLVTNENKELRGLFFQDQRMRDTFDSYPEFLCVDATYKVNDLRMPLYILLVENGNGQSEIVGVFLVADETEEMITEMVKMFKDQNPAWENVKTVMSDKDFVEREVFRKELPEATLRICLFHVLRTFRREVTIDKMGITRTERDKVLTIIQQLAYSRSIEEYDTLKNELYSLQIRSVNEYFARSWDDIKDQWVVELCTGQAFGNRTNNRLESINQKIKQVVDTNSKFDTFAKDFMVFLEGHRTEISGKACKASSKVPISVAPENTPEYEFRRVLTPYAFSIVEKQLAKHNSVNVQDNGETAKCDNYVLTLSTCSCGIKGQYNLPCKHIFAYRAHKQMDLFAPDLVPDRWSRKHYLGSLSHEQNPITVTQSVKGRSSKPSSQQQRYKGVLHLTNRLASCISESTGARYDLKLNQLQELLRAWENDNDIVIQTVASESEFIADDNNENGSADLIATESEHVQVIENERLSETHLYENEPVVPELLNENEPVVPELLNENEPVVPELLNENEPVVLELLNENEPVVPELLNENEPVVPELLNENEPVVPELLNENEPAVPELLNENEPVVSENENLLESNLSESEKGIATENANLPETDSIEIENEAVPENVSIVDSNENENETVVRELQDINGIKDICLPPNIKKRGRPKGSELTVIGIPRKRLKLRRAKIPFEKLQKSEQAGIILKWLVDSNVANECVRYDRKITKNDITETSQTVNMAITEIDINIISVYCESEALELVYELTTEAKCRKWSCKTCLEDLDTRCIACDLCLGWQHYHCANITCAPKTKLWFCQECSE